MSKCLTHTLGLVAEGSAQFAIMFDKFFDALNVCNFDEGKHERKPFKDPYRSSSDFRIKVCLIINCSYSIDFTIACFSVVRERIFALP